ncbi:MAG: NB-ARC domain-containing protein [Thermosynechococcaceae cyanobacterium]
MQSFYRPKNVYQEESDIRLERSKISDPFQGDALAGDHSELHDSLALLHGLLPNLDLTNTQTTVFLQSWQGRTYQQIADSHGYDSDYLKDVGHKLWRKLSLQLGEPISKHNFCSVLRRRFQEYQSVEAAEQAARILPASGPTSSSIAADKLICDWGEAPIVSVFAGRQQELALLKTAIVRDRKQLVGIFGFGGVGKTALAVNCVEQVAEHFDCLIWRSLRDTPDFDTLINGLLGRLWDQELENLPHAPNDKISLLLQAFQQHRCLLVIDDWSCVLQSESLSRAYEKSYRSYGLLLRRLSENQHQSCVIVVGRERPIGSAFRDTPICPVRTLYLKGLENQAGRECLEAFGLSSQNKNLDQLVERYAGNPYFLKVVSATVIDLFNSNVSEFLGQGNLIYGAVRNFLNQQFGRLSETERFIVENLWTSPELISLQDLEQAMTLSHKPISLIEGVESLYSRSFIDKTGAGFSLPWLLWTYANEGQ